MSNRILAILILLGFGGAIYAFYLYFYVYYKGDLEISSNLANYDVTLYSDTLKRSFSQNCSGDKCLFVGIPPVEYSLAATASGYVDIEQSLNIPKNSVAIAALNFEKKVSLESLANFEPKLSVQEKIKLFKENKLYKLIDNEAGAYQITRRDNSISILNESSEKIGDFGFTGGKKDITIHAIRGTNNIIWIDIQGKNYIYHRDYKQLSEINVSEDIKYIKKIDDETLGIIASENIYLYTSHIKKLENIGDSDDFIELQENKFTLKYENNSSTISLNSKTIYTTSDQLNQIYIQDEKIHVSSNTDKQYILKGWE